MQALNSDKTRVSLIQEEVQNTPHRDPKQMTAQRLKLGENLDKGPIG